ncbi:hypothetical protein DAPPUDRAFT_322937 [Daphnia pulex]|uniref:Uncharacterized protein n=1 Tax=Daphnia pulex TaxID=6669 RepID=E9GXC6_DAPPU|nr:hypothetical protein DAPPUDRAFT_322937 [Daphnia pulex]|eukprot:EFX75882.1 hypothetical protein DAPPUDRAFT_322937 [Daphnia pulex]
MRFGIAPIILLLVVFTIIQAQVQDTSKGPKDNARIFLSTFTVILSTVTSTATTTTVTTCTTSAGALITCSAGRRRRGLLYEDAENDGRSRRGLFYDEDETELKDGSISLSDNPVKRSAELTEKAIAHSDSTFEKTNSIPLTVQSGFSLPEGFPTGTPRFKLAFGTTTFTTTSTSISTRSLTATCASTTNYATCSNAGK